MARAARVLVSGAAADVMALENKISSVAKKNGPFDCILLSDGVGATSVAELKRAGICFSAPTFFAAQSFDGSEERKELPDHNLTYVGEASYEQIGELSIILLSAGYDDPPSKADESPANFPFPPEVATALRTAGTWGAGFRGIDVLLSGDRPYGLEASATTGEDSENGKKGGSTLTSATALATKPRYHFTGGRPREYVAISPFHVPGAAHVTRIIGLGEAPTKAVPSPKTRWVYAAAVVPLATMDKEGALPTSTLTTCPYKTCKEDAKVAQLQTEQPTGGFFFSMPPPSRQFVDNRKRANYGGPPGDRGRDVQRRRTTHPADAKCWFCLANEKDLQLVVSIGTEMYLALAKGGVAREHVLLMPITHTRSTLDLNSKGSDELKEFKQAVRAFYASTLSADALFFERVITLRGGDTHAHTQVQGIPVPKARSKLSAGLLQQMAKDTQIRILELPENVPLSTFIDEQDPSPEPEYFYVELPDGSRAVQLVSQDKKERASADNGGEDKHPVHPMQFGRRFAAMLLEAPDRVDWKRCSKPPDEEAADADAFRRGFANFDPSKQNS